MSQRHFGESGHSNQFWNLRPKHNRPFLFNKSRFSSGTRVAERGVARAITASSPKMISPYPFVVRLSYFQMPTSVPLSKKNHICPSGRLLSVPRRLFCGGNLASNSAMFSRSHVRLSSPMSLRSAVRSYSSMAHFNGTNRAWCSGWNSSVTITVAGFRSDFTCHYVQSQTQTSFR